MKAAALILLISAVPRGAWAGSISVSVLDNVISSAPIAGPGSPITGAACIGIPFPTRTCVSGPQPSNSLTAALGAAQSSAVASTNFSLPLSAAAQGSVVGDGIVEESQYFLIVTPMSTVPTFTVFPSILIDFSPDPSQQGVADASACQGTVTTVGLCFEMQLSGSNPASFSLNTGTGVMSLTGAAGDTGRLTLAIGSSFPIDLEFTNGVVVKSTNTLGLGLPAVGSSPDFDLGSITPFEVTNSTTSIDTENFVGQDAGFISQTPAPVPEPSSFLLCFAPIVAGMLISKRNAPSVSAGLPKDTKSSPKLRRA